MPWSWCWNSQEAVLGPLRGCNLIGKISVIGDDRMCNQYLLWAFDRGVGDSGGFYENNGWNTFWQYSVYISSYPSCRADLTFEVRTPKPGMYYDGWQCLDCPDGTTSGGGGTGWTFSCYSCSPGQYSSGETGHICKDCWGGTVPNANRNGCSYCPPGTYSGIRATTCVTCPAGTFSGWGYSGCPACPKGYASPAGAGGNSWAEACVACGIGYTTAGNGYGTCIKCATGFSADPRSGLSTCTQCPKGTAASPQAQSAAVSFADLPAQSVVTRCVSLCETPLEAPIR